MNKEKEKAIRSFELEERRKRGMNKSVKKTRDK
jgi:hypothetical protein